MTNVTKHYRLTMPRPFIYKRVTGKAGGGGGSVKYTQMCAHEALTFQTAATDLFIYYFRNTEQP